MVHECLNELLDEYCDSLKEVRKLKYMAQKRRAKDDASLLGGMETDLEWAMGYMVTGYPPMYSEGSYKKIVPVDPQEVLVYFTESLYKAWPENSESYMIQRLRTVMDDILTEKEKDALLMVLGERISYGKAGKYLGLKRSAVQSTVRRAVKKIRRCF